MVAVHPTSSPTHTPSPLTLPLVPIHSHPILPHSQAGDVARRVARDVAHARALLPGLPRSAAIETPRQGQRPKHADCQRAERSTAHVRYLDQNKGSVSETESSDKNSASLQSEACMVFAVASRDDQAMKTPKIESRRAPRYAINGVKFKGKTDYLGAIFP